ncbi:hypothetical protein CLU96_2279 [Chryseobacterium sp. 52]|nr:hypothetical protein CLU96_2279 [Chryseobacterium sp. 52]
MEILFCLNGLKPVPIEYKRCCHSMKIKNFNQDFSELPMHNVFNLKKQSVQKTFMSFVVVEGLTLGFNISPIRNIIIENRSF